MIASYKLGCNLNPWNGIETDMGNLEERRFTLKKEFVRMKTFDK